MITDGCNHWLGHKWPRWGEMEQHEQPGMAEGVVSFVQKRECERCGMVQYYSVVRLASAPSAASEG